MTSGILISKGQSCPTSSDVLSCQLITAVQTVNQLLYVFTTLYLQVCQVYSDERARGIHLTLCQLFIHQFCAFPVPRWRNHGYVHVHAILHLSSNIHVMSETTPSLFFSTLPPLYIIVNTNQRAETGKALELGSHAQILHHWLPDFIFCCSIFISVLCLLTLIVHLGNQERNVGPH